MSSNLNKCGTHNTVTEYDSSHALVKVHRFTGKSMFSTNCKATYRSDEGHLLNTRNFTLTKVTTDKDPCHYDAYPLGDPSCPGPCCPGNYCDSTAGKFCCAGQTCVDPSGNSTNGSGTCHMPVI